MRAELIHVLERFGIDLEAQARQPIQIPDCGRDDLARLFNELGYRTGAEIGVEEGLYSQILLESNLGSHLYAVDNYQTYSTYKDFRGQADLDALHTLALARLSPYDCTFIHEFSSDAVNRFEPNSLDFVYIDANHTFVYVVNDLWNWSARVRPGGIVAGHDFVGRKPGSPAMHVIEAVTGFTRSYNVNPWFLLGSKDIVPGEVRDCPRSWFWVKE